ncbi:MAG TPA: radical SAM protein, partial [Smithella sp.]|nr:radical SAM protein [Smithella sp.]HRS98344.1 radical SAM protein [Smithella sp.]
IARWLKEANCRWVDFGIQNINEEYRQTYLKRHETNENIIKTIQLLKKYKIVSFADYIIGLPGDTIEHYEEARLFFLENMPDIIEPYWMSYHPQTEILEKAFQLGILNDERMDLINRGGNPHSYFESSLASQDFHNQYYFIFKVVPSLPLFLRKRLTYKAARAIPYFLKLPIFIYSIIYLNVKHNNPRIDILKAFYGKQMMSILKTKYFSKKKS